MQHKACKGHWEFRFTFRSFWQPAQIHIHVHLRLAGTSLYRRCLFPNEFHKSLTALPHVSAIIQAEAGVISITFLFSILFPTSHVGIHLIGSKSQEQERYSLSLLLFYKAASAAASLSSALCGTFAFAPSLKAL